MINQPPLIATKLVVPKVKHEYIRRKNLTQKLQQISDFPLTIIEAPAGYGKSTALALFIMDEKPLCSWYTLSSADKDIFAFLSYLTAAIQHLFPTFGIDWIQPIRQSRRFYREEELHSFCTYFINEVMAVKKDFYLIMDDFHLVDHSFQVNDWMEQLLCYLPQNLHLIISGRTKPKWKQLSLMKAQGKLLEIKNEDLLLTEDEAELLLTDNFDLTLGKEEFKELYHFTGGWVTGIRLAAREVQKESIKSRSLISTAIFQNLFQYLESEIFSQQPPLIQQFLEQTSILERLTVDMCNHILGIRASEGILAQLAEENVFIEKTEDNHYQIQPLFKSFLELRLKENDAERYRLLHETCARFYEEKEDYQNAIYHYEKINGETAIASLLKEYGKQLLSKGKLDYLNDKLKGISEEIKDIYYELWFIQGEVYRYRSLYKKAEQCYESIIAAAKKKKDDYAVSKGLEGRARIFLDTIQPYKAKRFLYQVIEIRQGCKQSSEREMGELYYLLSENLINYGQAQKAEKWFKKAQSLHLPQIDRNLEARLYLRTGRLKKARNILHDPEKQQHIPLPQSHRETSLLLSLIESFTGNGEKAKSLAREGIEYGVHIDSKFVEACGWIRYGHAAQLTNRKNSVHVIHCYETALEIMEELNVARGKAEPLMGLTLYYGFAKENEKALEFGHLALRETEKVQDMWLASLITLSMGIAAVMNHHFMQAKEFFEQTEKSLQECGDDYAMTLLLLWYSYYYYQLQDMESFRLTIKRLINMVQRGSYEFLFHQLTLFGPRDLQMMAPLLIEANKQKISPQFIPRLLRELHLSHLDSHPGYTLRIQTLGAFRLWLGDTEITERDWPREKAKELLQLLITKYGENLTKDDICEYLWPQKNEQNALRDFKVALHALNNVLEPERKARANPFFIKREGAAYGINQDIPLELDALLFEKWVIAGLEEREESTSISYLSTALGYYKGDFLPERKYDDWCLSKREKLLVLFLRGAEKLAQLKVNREDYNGAIYWCEQILEKDQTWEEAYRLLMYCYYEMKNRPFSIKWFQKCCEVLQREMGVKPLASTLQMYHSIINSQ